MEKGEAYYCFCTKERLESLKEANAEGVSFAKYDRHCLHLSPEEVQAKLAAGEPFVIRQKMPESGTTSFHDMVYGDITVDNAELDDQILMKADGFPTYNFANVVDDHLMHITHVVRGSEYLSSTPKYNLLYKAFGWEPPIYVHLPAVVRDAHHKLSKRHGDKSFEDLVNEGYVVEAIVNYIALLGWSPSDNVEIFTLKELEQKFDMAGLSKSPSIFDIKKLTWMNSEYLKAMDFYKYFELARPKLEEALAGTDLDLKKIAALLQKRLETLNDIPRLVDFFKELPDYSTELYTHKKMKTNDEIALSSLQAALPVLENLSDWNETAIHDSLMALVGELGINNGKLLWPVRTALSGEQTSPGGAMELADILGKEEALRRIRKRMLTVRSRDSVIRVYFDRIEFIESRNKHCIIHCSCGVTYISCQSLSSIEQVLDRRFLRCHQSYIVNMDFIKKAGTDFVVFSGSVVPIRKRNVRAIKEKYLEYIK